MGISLSLLPGKAGNGASIVNFPLSLSFDIKNSGLTSFGNVYCLDHDQDSPIC
jgi:hypothetical protein